MNSDHSLDFPKERPFSCLERPSSLQILAASKIASRLWLNKYHVQTGYERGRWVPPPNWPRSLSVFSCKDMLAVPPRIRDMIDDCIFLVGNQIAAWEDNLRKAVLQSSRSTVRDKKLVKIFAKCFDGIDCKPNGDICFESSARNALMMRELHITTKLGIACKFCLEDEIREIWSSQLVSQTPNVFGNSTLMQYWENTLRNNFFAYEPFVVELLADSLADQNWAAFEYFWNKLSEERQTVEAIKIVKTHDFSISRRVLLKLNEKQAREVVRGQSIDKIVVEVISNKEFSWYAIQLCTCIKHLIPGSVFGRIVRLLWRMVFKPKESELTKIKLSNVLLRELWSGAPESSKSYVSARDLFAELDGNLRDISYYDSTFMCEVLENASDYTMMEIWENNWYKILIRASISDIKKLMKLCSVNDDEMDLSRERNSSKLEELRDYFNSLIKYGLYSELCEFLGFFVKDKYRLETLSKELIFTNLHHICACDDDEELDELRSFIYFTFRTTETANTFIEDLISSPQYSTWIYNKLDEYCYDDVTNLCIKFPSSDEKMRNIKRQLLMYCYSNFSNGQIMEFNARKFTKFSYWCCDGGGNALAEFKREINIDDIFKTVLDNLMRELIESRTLNGAVLSKFEEFLMCFFVNVETYRAYKSAKMPVYCKDCQLMKSAIRNQFLIPHVDFLLNWGMGFVNDAGQTSKKRRENLMWVLF
ncbi:uncharacterized protein LOC135845036 [Planococcus citri]|uniref:uncharacterized protein LOC135845036 n=1 Tax=Planococcus citri TaxID=170843 RepID=UPI0031F95F7F